MFDPAGALACVPLLIPQGSQLAALVQNQPDPTKQVKIPANDLRVNQFHYFTSQLGLVLYGRDEFLALGAILTSPTARPRTSA